MQTQVGRLEDCIRMQVCLNDQDYKDREQMELLGFEQQVKLSP